jgi:hypothetical protein
MNPIGGTGHRAFQDCVRVKRSCDFWKRPASTPVLHHGSSGDDAETGVFGEHRDQLVGHAIGEVVLRRVSGQVVEGKHSQGADDGLRVAMEQAFPQGVRAQGHDGDGNE